MSTKDHKVYNTKALATYFVFMTETCTPSLPLLGPHRLADLKTSVREKSANCWRENLLLDLFEAITDCLSFFVSSADFHVPSEYLTNIHIRDKVTATVIITSSIIISAASKWCRRLIVLPPHFHSWLLSNWPDTARTCCSTCTT